MKGRGTINLNRNRYWWKVRLPGTSKTKQIPLKPLDSRQATKDRKTAELVAAELWEKHLAASTPNPTYEGRLASLVEMYHTRNL